MFEQRNFQTAIKKQENLSDNSVVEGLLPLTEHVRGSRLRIATVLAGKGAEANLRSLGIWKGNIIEIARVSRLRGPVTIIYMDTEIAIGHKLAERILAEKI